MTGGGIHAVIVALRIIELLSVLAVLGSVGSRWWRTRATALLGALRLADLLLDVEERARRCGRCRTGG